MGLLTSITITPAGMSPLQCACGKNLTHEQVQSLGGNLLECACGHTMFDVFCCQASINPNCAHFLDDAEVFAATWYHLTDRADWQVDSLADAGDETVMVHLGTLDAALAIETDKGWDKRKTPLYLYEVTLAPGTVLNSAILKDDDVWPEEVGDCGQDWADASFVAGINRYVNAVESAGSISLVVDARCAQVLMRHEV